MYTDTFSPYAFEQARRQGTGNERESRGTMGTPLPSPSHLS